MAGPGTIHAVALGREIYVKPAQHRRKNFQGILLHPGLHMEM